MSAGNIFASGCFPTPVHSLYTRDDNKNINVARKVNSTVNLSTPQCNNLQGVQRNQYEDLESLWKPILSNKTKQNKKHAGNLMPGNRKQNLTIHRLDQEVPALFSQHCVRWESHQSHTKSLKLLFQHCK